DSYPYSVPSKILRPSRICTLIQLEVDSQVEDDVDRLSVKRPGFEFPAFDRIDGRLIQAKRQRLQDLNVRHVAAFVDDAFDDHDAGDARFAGDFRIDGLDAIDHDRGFDVAADAQRRFNFRRGIRDHAAHHPTHHAPRHATFDTALHPFGGRG